MSVLTQAIQNLCPGSEFSYSDDDYSTIQWIILNGEAPTQEAIEAEIKLIEEEKTRAAALKAEAKAGLLERLGITAEEAELLLA